jgi:hypothetical protein
MRMGMMCYGMMGRSMGMIQHGIIGLGMMMGHRHAVGILFPQCLDRDDNNNTIRSRFA